MAARIPLILLPGLLCDATLWRHQTRTLSDVADIIVPDLTQDDSIGGMAERVLAAAPSEFALAGLSMGGYVAQEIMRRAHRRVIRLGLIDTSARADTPEQIERRKGLIKQAEMGEFKGVTSRLLPLLIHPDRLGDQVLTGTVRRMAENVGKTAFLNQQKAIMGRPDGREDLTRIACPSLILCGRQDSLTPVEVHREMATAITNAALVIVEDCGHLAPLERAVTVSAVLRYWLQR